MSLIVTMSDTVPGREIASVLGVARGNVVRARVFGRDFIAGLRNLGGGEALFQPVEAEIGDRWHEDQHFRQHDEENGERQKATRQGTAQRAQKPRKAAFGNPAIAVFGRGSHTVR